MAPPCRGPFRVATAATMAACRSVRVATPTRAANVEALSSWSACRVSTRSRTRATSRDGALPSRSSRKYAAWDVGARRRHGRPAGADPLPGGDRLRHQGHQPERLAQIGVGLVRAHVGVAGRGQRDARCAARRADARHAAGSGADPRTGAGRPRAAASREAKSADSAAEGSSPRQRSAVTSSNETRAGQIGDLVAPVVELPALAVDLADRRPRRDDVLEPRLPPRLHRRLL